MGQRLKATLQSSLIGDCTVIWRNCHPWQDPIKPIQTPGLAGFGWVARGLRFGVMITEKYCFTTCSLRIERPFGVSHPATLYHNLPACLPVELAVSTINIIFADDWEVGGGYGTQVDAIGADINICISSTSQPNWIV